MRGRLQHPQSSNTAASCCPLISLFSWSSSSVGTKQALSTVSDRRTDFQCQNSIYSSGIIILISRELMLNRLKLPKKKKKKIASFWRSTSVSLSQSGWHTEGWSFTIVSWQMLPRPAELIARGTTDALPDTGRWLTWVLPGKLERELSGLNQLELCSAFHHQKSFSCYLYILLGLCVLTL